MSPENQVELSWDPYEELTAISEVKSTTGEVQLSAEQERIAREQEQALGVAAMVGMLESGKSEEVTDEIDEDEPEVWNDEIDTVIVRARQALGEGQFEALTHQMMYSAERDLPEETMKKFRESAGVSLMDAGELWQAVLAESKRERFEPISEYAEKGKFYYSMSIKDLKKALETGRVERKDKSGNCLKSDLELSGDYCEDGEWKSGFADSRGDVSTDVTLVLDGSLINAEDFVALRNNPTVDAIDLEKYCLGFVSDFSSRMGRKVNQMVRKSDFYKILVYQDKDVDGRGWATSMYPADYLRFMAQKHGEEMENYQNDRKEVYEDVDREGLREKIEKFARKMKRSGMEKMILQHESKIEQEEQREQLGYDLARYYGVALGIDALPKIEWYYDPEDDSRGYCRAGKVGLNWGRLEDDGMRGVVRTLGHEMRHVYQHNLVKEWKDNPEDLTEDERRLAELFDLNFQNPVKGQDDLYTYQNQIVEADAQIFAMACEGVYIRAHKEVDRPINRVKRGAEAVRKSASRLGYQGKRVAKKGAERMKKVGKRNG